MGKHDSDRPKCSTCHGTGKGETIGSTCGACGGSGYGFSQAG